MISRASISGGGVGSGAGGIAETAPGVSGSSNVKVDVGEARQSPEPQAMLIARVIRRICVVVGHSLWRESTGDMIMRRP